MLNSELQWIERESDVLLSGIMKQTIQDIEIIVVDSGSTDVTVPIASRYPVKTLSSKNGDGRSAKIPIPAASNGALRNFSYGSHYRLSA